MSRAHRVTAVASGLVVAVIVSGAAIGTAASSFAAQHRDTTAPALSDTTPSESVSPSPEPAPPAITNVVLIMADDLDWQTFMQVPRLAALREQGTTFTQHVVTDSLCCPSRTSVLRSQFVHNHQVISNVQSTGGGWPTFQARGEEQDCLPTWLSASGVRTAMIGKFLNEYPGPADPKTYVPPGWSTWVVPTKHGYEGYNYTLNINGRIEKHGRAPKDYLNDVLDENAANFIRTSSSPFYLELTPFAPHLPAPVAPRHVAADPDAIAPRTLNYGATGTGEPSWLAGVPAITAKRAAAMDRVWRQRVRSTEAVADSVETVMATLRATGKADSTLVLITSDNGFHAGNHRLSAGKRTAFREDAVVPLVAIGPGIARGATVTAVTSTIDFGPTFAALLKATVPTWIDGRSLVPFLQQPTTPAGWRTATITENDGTSLPDDPDFTPQSPPRYVAMRSNQWLLVLYANGERELYNEVSDPYELNNVVNSTDPTIVAQLTAQAQALAACSGATCRVADAMPQPVPGIPVSASPSATPSSSESATPSAS
jgi:N-acetylglucosamine-6-sulfatase